MPTSPDASSELPPPSPDFSPVPAPDLDSQSVLVAGVLAERGIQSASILSPDAPALTLPARETDLPGLLRALPLLSILSAPLSPPLPSPFPSPRHTDAPVRTTRTLEVVRRSSSLFWRVLPDPIPTR